MSHNLLLVAAMFSLIFINGLQRAAADEPTAASGFYERGQSYDKKDEYDKAIADYSKAIEINPKFGMAYYMRGSSRYLKGLTGGGDMQFRQPTYDDAVADSSKAIKFCTDAEKPFAYLLRGNVYYEQEKIDEAIDDFTTSISLNPKNAMTYEHRAQAYKKRGEAYRKKGESSKAYSDESKAEDDIKKAEALKRM